MQIKGLISYIYFLFIEKEIKSYLEKSNKYITSSSYIIPSTRKKPDFGHLNDQIDFFKSKFKENFTEEQNNRMLYNLSFLKIVEKKVKSNFQSEISVGSYDSLNNTITLNSYENVGIDYDLEEVLVHELLHMASTNYSTIGERTGFDLFDIIGTKLNEGYTEYLTKKYFTRGYKYTEANDNYLFIAKGIENIIGREKMEEYYFTSDLNSVIRELSKYVSKEDAIKLIYLIDMMPSTKSKEFDYLVKKVSQINGIKLDKDLASGVISKKQYEEEYAIKVREYRMYQIWSEDTVILGDENIFILKDHEYESKLYDRKEISQKAQTFKKTLY